MQELVIYVRACELSPNLILAEPLSPELDRVLQTFKRGLAAEDDGVRDLEGLSEAGPHKLFGPLDEGVLVVGQTHGEVGKGLVEPVSVLRVQFAMVAHAESAHFVEV